jgi:hypothetical protein
MPPHVLTDLVVDEVSLCDAPSNASTDPRTGRKIPRAVVALHKRDSDSGELELQKFMDETEARRRAEKEVGKMGKLKTILKSASATRESIAEAVEAKAQKIAKRENLSMDAALSRAWSEDAHLAYERAAKGEPKRPERPMFRCTPAEARLDSAARKILKRNSGLSYAQACSKALTPELMESYERERREGILYDVPVVKEYLSAQPGSKRASDGDGDVDEAPDDADECPDCGAEIDPGDAFCASCGKELEKKKDDPGSQSVGVGKRRKARA